MAENRTPTGASGVAAATKLITERAPGRRGEILAAAFAVFSEHGYDTGSMRDIASRVGVSEPALYRHFASKEEMFLELMDVLGSFMRAGTFALLDLVRADALRSQLVFGLKDRRETLARFSSLVSTMLFTASRNQRFLERYRELMIVPVRTKLTETATRLDEEFSVAEGDRDRDARVRALMALFVGTFVTGFVLGDTPDEETADAVLRVMRWDGAGVPGTPAALDA